jgi:hypothetical protein
MVMLHFPLVQLKYEPIAIIEALILASSMPAGKAKHLLIPKTTGFNVAYAD